MKTNQAFTLIELLVVVLIIGILAAVALPQYRKAVEKSRAAQAFAMIRSVAAAQEAYHLANGVYATSFDQLDVDIPWTGNTMWEGGSPAKSNKDWSIQLYDTPGGGNGISVGRISGPYKGGGFIYLLKSAYETYIPARKLVCVERRSNGISFDKEEGCYCKQIFKGKYIAGADGALSKYTLP